MNDVYPHIRRLAEDWERIAAEIQHDFGRNGGESKLIKADTLWWCAKRLRILVENMPNYDSTTDNRLTQ